ncbi:MAG TPA: DUF2795 domain-containing protein [Planctomycetota bacterium]|nr:DUF2795 domain-containing protein [Planctomycetota bacterium]
MSRKTIGYFIGAALCIAGLVLVLAIGKDAAAAKPPAIATWELFKGIEMPAGRQDLLDHAKDAKAPDEALALLEKLPDKEYRTLYDVNAALEAKSILAVIGGILTNAYVIGGLLFVAGLVAGLMYTHAPTIAWRELSGYFVSPVAYILMAAYLVGVSLAFNFDIHATGRAQMEQTFNLMMMFALFLCPVITMRLLSEEARSGTLETMFTVPVTDFELTVGKFLGGYLFFLIMQVPTLAFLAVLKKYGNPDVGVAAVSYIGIALLGSVLISLGLLVSSFTKNQVISAFVTFVVILVLLMLSQMGQYMGGTAGRVLSYVSCFYHYEDFARGIIGSRQVLYYLTTTSFLVFITVRAVESHKWR